jgi:predicted Zn-dependent peptidase
VAEIAAAPLAREQGRPRPREIGRAWAALAALAFGLALSCASRPPLSPDSAQRPAARPAAPSAGELPAPRSQAGSASASTRIYESARPPKERVDYLEASLADYRRLVLPNGATIAVKRQEGRSAAVARIVLARDLSASPAEAGYEALALSAAARGASGSAPGSVELAAFEASASIELKLEDYDDVALEIVSPAKAIGGLLALFAASLSSPAFSQEDFDRALREARVAERRESGDPLLRAAAELRSSLYGGHPYALPPRGTALSLAGATREGVMRYWSKRFGARRLFVVLVCDADPDERIKSLAAQFGSLPPGGDAGPAQAGEGQPGARAPALPIRPWFKALPLSATPGSAMIRGEFGAPDPASEDYAAMTVALAMLDDLLLERLRGGKGLAYGAWSRLSSSAAPSASLTVYKTSDPAAAKAGVDWAIGELASGRCLDAAGGSQGSLAASLESYKARAITAAYSKGASSQGMAAHIARDLASGGDGTALFRLAGRIEAVQAGDVVRVARERLRDGPSAWVALGDPALVLGLPVAAFVKR